jgi:hypothetical protein
MSFKKAEKSKSKMRGAFFGPSGSGKTFSALSVASGIAEKINSKIAVIDSEHGSSAKYADRFTFDIVELGTKTIAEYVANIAEAQKAGYGVLIIDSLSHAWQELLEEVDRIGKTKFKGNSWAAWQEGTPKQKKLVDAILSFNGHVIVTMRSKTEWQTGIDQDGKKNIKRIGLAPEQGKGIEYEFDLLLEISTDHIAEVIKDRTGKFQDKIIDKPGVEFGKELIDWLNTGSDPKEEPKVDYAVQQKEMLDKFKMLKAENKIPTTEIVAIDALIKYLEGVNPEMDKERWRRARDRFLALKPESEQKEIF